MEYGLAALPLTTLDCLFETDTRQHVSAGLMQRELPLQTNLNIFLSCMENRYGNLQLRGWS